MSIKQQQTKGLTMSKRAVMESVFDKVESARQEFEDGTRSDISPLDIVIHTMLKDLGEIIEDYLDSGDLED